MSYKPLWMLPALILLCASCKKSSSPEERRNLLLESSFESTTPFNAWDNDQHCCDYSLMQSTDRATDGTHSLYLNVRNTDPIVSSSIRSELVQPVEPEGTERWYGLMLYLQNWDHDNAGESVFQWHPDSQGGSAAGSLWTSGGRFEFVTTHMRGANGNGGWDLGPIISNQWVSWVIHVKWASDNTGILQVWKNDVLLIDSKNIMTGPPIATYFKLGINKFGWGIFPSTTTQRVLYFDEVRIGNEKARYQDVRPGTR